MFVWVAANRNSKDDTEYLCDYFSTDGSEQKQFPKESILLYYGTLGVLYQGSSVDKNVNTKCFSDISIAFKTEHYSQHAEFD